MSKTQSRLGVTIDNKCKSIDLFLTPAIGEPGELVTLHVNGLIDTDDEWNTWEWEYADKFGIGSDYNDEPVWAEYQTGGVTHTIGEDDRVVRVKLTIGDCVYYSNESGYENRIDVPYATVYKETQTFIESSGATKLDFTGATISNQTNGLLTTSVVNDNFVAAVTVTPWEINYSGHLTFETALASTQRIVIAVFIDGVIVPESRQIVVVPEGTDYQIPFSKTYIQSVPLADTVDLRFDATLGDITAIDTTLTLKGLTL